MNDHNRADKSSDTMRWLRSFFSGVEKPAAAESEVAPAASHPAVAKKHKKILVVDDDPLFLKLTCSRLESDGFDVVAAADGSEAIREARKQKPNLMVLDVNLPTDVAGVAWDGYRVSSWMKRFDELKGIPIVMMTAGDPVLSTRLALGAGAVAFFHKRMDPSHLLTMVNYALARKPPQPEATSRPSASFQI